MAKVLLDVILVEGTNKQEFVDRFNADTEADWWNMLGSMPTLLVMNVEEDYIETFRSHSSVVQAIEIPESFEASTPPSVEEMTKWFTSNTSSFHRHPSNKGEDNAPTQFIYDTNQIVPFDGDAFTVGRSDNQFSTRGEYTYKSRWTGKHVDIVTLEAGSSGNWASNKGFHDLHPDFQKLTSEDDSHTSNGTTTPYWYQCAIHSNMRNIITVDPADGTRNTYNISVSFGGTGIYILSGSDRNGTVSGDNPPISIKEGDTLIFNVNAPGHPFLIRYYNGNIVDDGSVDDNTGIQVGVVTWTTRTSSRFTPMNWPDLEEDANNQVTTQDGGNSGLTAHAIGVLSVAGGTICGFAKKANLYAMYLVTGDSPTECIQSLIDWHNAKPVNPETGEKNPTIMIAEYQYLQDRKTAIPVDSIYKINKADGTEVTRPGTSWGSDYSEFIKENIIPFRVYDPSSLNYSWNVVMPQQYQYSSLKIALDSAWNNGIVCINAAGNNGGTFNKDSSKYATSLDVDAGPDYSVINVEYGLDNTATTSSITTWYPFISYGPHGVDSNIDVAAGYNSEEYPGLDGYSNRGPGIDIVGLGANTWSSYPTTTYGDEYKWGMFSGTSCATPTVVGKVACIMEEYFWYNGTWPTPDKTKEILLSKAKNKCKGMSSGSAGFSWSNVPSASGTSISNTISSGNLIIYNGNSGNGGFKYTELTGTTSLRAYFDPQDQDNHPFLHKIKHHHKRPVSGMTYPRVNNSVGRHRMNLPDMT